MPNGSHLKQNVRLTSMAMSNMDDGFSDSDIDDSENEEEDQTENKVHEGNGEIVTLPSLDNARKASNQKAGYAGAGREWTFAEFCNENEAEISSASSDDLENDDENRRRRIKEKRLLLAQQACGLAGDDSQSVQKAFAYAHSFEDSSNDSVSLKYLHSLGYVSTRMVSRRTSKTLGSLSELTLGPRSVSNNTVENEEDETAMLEQDRKFASEIYGMITREDANINDVAVEIKSYTLAEDRFHTDSVMAAVPAILDLVKRDSASNSTEFLKNMNEMLETWSKLLLRFRYSEQEEIIEISILNALEEYCLIPKNKLFADMFFFCLHSFVEFEVVSGESVLKWSKDIETDSDSQVLLNAKGMKQWLTMLEEESEEETDSSDDEDDDDDDDDDDDE